MFTRDAGERRGMLLHYSDSRPYPVEPLRSSRRVTMNPPSSSTRYGIVAITAVAAMWMYIDRVCFSTMADPIQTDLGLSDRERSWILGAFFFTYALFQIPMGSLADRFGARTVLALSIAAWSGVTAATGFAEGFLSLLGIRLLLGITEAGAYPAAAGLVKRWAKPEERGRFSSVVSLGGRVGGAVSPSLTTWLAGVLAAVVIGSWTLGPSGTNWRAVFAIYGVCGIAVAIVFWIFVRDHPPGGVVAGLPDSSVKADQPQPILANPLPPSVNLGPSFLTQLGRMARTPRMWIFGALQFCNNLAWAFLITLLPTYLKDRGVPLDERGNVQTLILFVGCIGMVIGGLLTDQVYRRFGPRWGRSLPIMTVMSGCALMCSIMATTPPLWLAITALAFLAFCQDLGIPSVWAYAQDVSGKNVGAVLGFGNMLGNFGAALSPILLTEIQLEGGWSAAFGVCAVAYLVSIGCGYRLDASKTLDIGAA